MAGVTLPGGQPLPGRMLRLAVADDDRAAVVGDTLRRAATGHRVPVIVARTGPDRLDLNVPPPDVPRLDALDVAVGTLAAGELVGELAVGELGVGGPAGGAGSRGVPAPARHTLEVRPWSRPDEPGDPLAVRLLLLATPLADDVDAAGLPGAAEELARWRRRVGEWARLPSAAPPADAVAAVRAAVDDGLDTPRAVALLRDLETDESVPPGARMEAFLTLDRLLGLDLALGLVGR